MEMRSYNNHKELFSLGIIAIVCVFAVAICSIAILRVEETWMEILLLIAILFSLIISLYSSYIHVEFVVISDNSIFIGNSFRRKEYPFSDMERIEYFDDKGLYLHSLKGKERYFSFTFDPMFFEKEKELSVLARDMNRKMINMDGNHFTIR
jgi:hypothetical protein